MKQQSTQHIHGACIRNNLAIKKFGSTNVIGHLQNWKPNHLQAAGNVSTLFFFRSLLALEDEEFYAI
eukprot:scaffold2830_cov131-Cylindrotheca_fusiformis.AAC.4